MPKGACSLLYLAIFFSQTAASDNTPVELICDGTYWFLGPDKKGVEVDLSGVYIRLEEQGIRFAGGIGELSNAFIPVKKRNEAEVIAEGAFTVAVNRFSGRLIAHREIEGGDKVEFFYEAKCARRAPLF